MKTTAIMLTLVGLAVLCPVGHALAVVEDGTYPPINPDDIVFGDGTISVPYYVYDVPPPDPSAATVPEPATLAMLAVGALALVRRARRKAWAIPPRRSGR